MSSSTSSKDQDPEKAIHQDEPPPKRPSDNLKPHPSEFLEFATVHDHGIRRGGPKLEPIKTVAGPESTSGLLNPTTSSDDLYNGLAAAIPNLRRLSIEARAATKREHKMTFLSACRQYPKAIAWSVLLTLTIVMEGYDLTLINSFFAFPVFRRNYGTPLYPGRPFGQQDFQISPAWQAGLTNGAVSAEILGLLFNGYLADRFGYHKTMLFALVWMCLFVFLAFFAVNIQMLLTSQILCGLPWVSGSSLSRSLTGV